MANTSRIKEATGAEQARLTQADAGLSASPVAFKFLTASFGTDHS